MGSRFERLTAAPSDPKILVAGTLKGVYRSTDGGEHWQLISPEGSQEIHEVESIAIDPVDPQIIYAGTWHLPWKTTDGGEHWTNIKQGIIDDSDVFSIIVDPKDPKCGVCERVLGNLQERERRREVSEDAGNSFDGAANESADAGPAESEHCLCGDDGGSVPDGRFGRDLACGRPGRR